MRNGLTKNIYYEKIKFIASNSKTKISLPLFQSVFKVYLQKIIQAFAITQYKPNMEVHFSYIYPISKMIYIYIYKHILSKQFSFTFTNFYNTEIFFCYIYIYFIYIFLYIYIFFIYIYFILYIAQ